LTFCPKFSKTDAAIAAIPKKENTMSPQNRKLSPRIDGRLAAYATVAGAALAAPAIPTTDATIIWSGPVNINIPSTTAGVYLNFFTGVNDPNPANVPSWDVNPYGSASLTMFNPSAPAGGVYVGDASGYYNLTPGTLISAASTYTSGNISPTSPNPLNFNSSGNLIGIRFVDPNLNGGAVTYGWMRIMLSGTQASQPRAIVEYAYENSVGVGIAAGAIPEPSTLALLGVMAAGALGVRAWRKHKNS
jgi:hypothetical protein